MRHFRHAPGFAATSVLTLAAGIAVNVAMCTVYWRVVLNPLRVVEPASLVSLYAAHPSATGVPETLSWPRFQAIAGSARAFSSVGAYSFDNVTLSAPGQAPEQLRALRVSGPFFETIGLAVAHGRAFDASHDQPNGAAVCLLTHELWQSRFGGASVIGTTIAIDGRAAEIIGILPPRLSPPWAERQIVVPRVFEDSGVAPRGVATGASFLFAVGRLAPGVSIDQARAELASIAAGYAARFGSYGDADNETRARPLVDTVAGSRRPVFISMLGGVGAVLLIACANVAALFVSRLVGRQRELAVRQALGATRARIVRQIAVEALTLAAAGGALGLVLAAAMLAAAESVLAPQLPPGVTLGVDLVTGAAAAGAVAVCAALVGVLPALYITRASATAGVAGVDRGLTGGAAARRFRGALVVIETALSVLLLVGATLLLASLVRLQQTSPGFEPSGVAAGFFNLAADRYPTAERQEAFYRELLDRVKASPQVSGAAVAFGLPFHDENYAHTYLLQGQPIVPPSERARAGVRAVSEDYFAVMRVPLLEGRFFTAADRAGSQRVCILNASLARRLFGGRSAIGQTILRGRNADQAHAIVGVVADVATYGLRQDTPDEIFYPFGQNARPNAAILARVAGDPASLAAIFRSAAAGIDPMQPVSRFASMEQRLQGTIGIERLMTALTSGFAALALLLAAIGLYAVLAHGVAARRREIGIRMAVGAGRPRIARMVLWQGLRLVSTGIVLGSIAAAALSGAAAAYLYHVDALDPRVYLSVAGTFALVGAAASLAPALRASRVDPIVSLRAS